MNAVDMVDSGKFNYHLGKLRGVYVRKVQGGYVPTAAATALYRAVIAHQPHRDGQRRRFGVESECPDCGAAVVGTHERGFLSVDCGSCEEWVGFSYPFPRNGFAARSDEEVMRAVHRRCKHHLALARSGQCPFCAATTTTAVDEEAVEGGTDPAVEIACDSCSFRVGSRLLFPLLLDTRVSAVLVNRGFDPERYEWELPELPTRLVGRDPLRIRVEVQGENGTTAMIIDGDCSLCAVETDQ
jgi:hypothetical protein